MKILIASKFRFFFKLLFEIAFFTKNTVWGKVGKEGCFFVVVVWEARGIRKKLLSYAFFVKFPSKSNPSVGNANKAIFKSSHMT